MPIRRKKIRSTFLALMATVLICCGTPGVDSQQPKPGSDRITAGNAPQLVGPGVVSTTMGEYSPSLDVKRNELYFMRRTPGKYDYTIYYSKFKRENWTKPKIAPFSGEFRDAGSYLSPSGDQIFFDSRRPAEGLAKDSINIWRAVRTGDSWGEAELLRVPSENPPAVNGIGDDEFGPAVDGDGRLYFYSFRTPFRGGAWYVSKDKLYDSVELSESIPDPSSPTFVSYLYISPDGKTAIMEGRAKGRNDTDIFYSCRGADGKWSDAGPLPVVNTESSEGGPWMTSDGEMLLFASSRPIAEMGSTTSNIFIVSTSQLPVPCVR